MANAGDCSIELLPDVFRKTIVAKRNLSLDKGHFITVGKNQETKGTVGDGREEGSCRIQQQVNAKAASKNE